MNHTLAVKSDTAILTMTSPDAEDLKQLLSMKDRCLESGEIFMERAIRKVF